MIRGSLNSKNIKWDNYLSPKFVPFIKDDYKWSTCGTPTLSLITGISCRTVEKYKPIKRKHWSNVSFKRFLINRNYTIIEVTKRNITKVNYWEFYPLKPDHLIILNLEMDEKEASWFLLHKNNLYHNKFREDNFNSLFFLNKPPQNVFLVYHKKWS